MNQRMKIKKADFKQKNLGIMYILVSAFFFALMSFCVRMAGDLPTMQKAFFRNFVAALVSGAMLLKSNEGFKIKKEGLPFLVLRALFGTFGIYCNFYALDHMNISDASMLNKLSPFFAVIMSVFILREKANGIEWMTIGIAFVGALFVAKPSFNVEVVPALIGFAGGFFAGTAYTFVRKLGKMGERGPVIVMFFSAFSCIITLPKIIFDYHEMSWIQLIYLLVAGTCAAIGQISITAAYTKAPAKEISVFDYSNVIFSAILGCIFLGQYPDRYSIIGYAIIIGAAIVKWKHNNRNTDGGNSK